MKGRNILLSIVLLTSILFTTIVYAAFSTQLNIEGEAIVRSDQDIRITNISIQSQTNGAYETYNNKYNKDTTFMYVTLPSNSSIIYEATITNKVSESYLIYSITQESHTNSNVDIDISLNENDVVNANSTKTFTITLTNNTSIEQQETLVYQYEFKLNNFTVTFDANGGSVSQTTKEVSYGSSYGQLPTPTRDGYKFLGWNGANYFNYASVNTSSSGVTTDSDGFITINTSNGTMYYKYFTDNLNVKPNSVYNAFIEIDDSSNLTGILYLASGYKVGYGIHSQFLGQGVASEYLISQTNLKFYITTDDNIFTNNEGLRTFYLNANNNSNEYIKFRISILDVNDKLSPNNFKYEPYYIQDTTTVVQPNNHTLTAMWEDITPPEADFKMETINNENYIVIDTYDIGSGIASVKTSNGTIVPKNEKQLKIYVSGYTAITDHTNYEKILTDAGYTNFTISNGSYPTVETLTSEGYNVFINNKSVWSVPSTVNSYFASGINLITIGNDSTNELSIIDTATDTGTSAVGTYSKLVNNNITKKLPNLGRSDSDSRQLIKFKGGTEVLYKETVGETVYDAVGYYTSNGTKWIHSQISSIASYIIPTSLDYIANKGLYYYKVTSKGTYSFIVTDNAGNDSTVSYTYE